MGRGREEEGRFYLIYYVFLCLCVGAIYCCMDGDGARVGAGSGIGVGVEALLSVLEGGGEGREGWAPTY